MKILYITGQLYLHGGIERVTSMKVNYLAEHTNHEVYLSTYKQKNSPFVYPISSKVNIEDIGIGYDVNYSTRPLYSIRQFKWVPKHVWRTYKLLQRLKPDVIVVPNFDYEYWFLPFIKGGSKIIREFHGTQIHNKSIAKYSKYWFKMKFDNYIQTLYDKIVVLTQDEVTFFEHKDNIEVIPNPIEKSTLKSTLSSKQIVSIGRIHPVKQFEKLIDIASILLASYPDYSFSIYGGGDDFYMSILQKKISELGLTDKVIFRGETNDVYKVLSESCMYVCTSSEESFGMTLIEAQECGLPVVSFNCPCGPRNIIHNGKDGFLVPLNSLQDTYNAISLIIKDEKLKKQLGCNAIQNAKIFHIEHVMLNWNKLFQNLL